MAGDSVNELSLPVPDGTSRKYRPVAREPASPPEGPIRSRTVLAAPHVTAHVLGDYSPGVEAPVDWDATLAYRRHLWRWGMGVAEAMDTSERGPGGLTWDQAKELITRSIEAAQADNGLIVCGAGTDQLAAVSPSLAQIVESYAEQAGFIDDLGGSAVLRCSHALARVATGPEDYLDVYGQVLGGLSRPAIVHWVGGVFDRDLEDYWGFPDHDSSIDVMTELARRHRDRIDGFKVSVLDAPAEERLRGSLPAGVRVYTGDDHNYPRLIAGDDRGYSHAFLGVLGPLAPVAAHAFGLLDRGDARGFEDAMTSTLPFAHRMFAAPAREYRTDAVFCAYLSGFQDHFRMITGREGMRSIAHLADLYACGDELGIFPDPQLAATRMRRVLEISGWDA